MNKKRREEIKAITDTLSDCSSKLQSVLSDEDSDRDNMPENLEGSPNYVHSEECSDTLEDAVSDLDDIIASLETIS